MLNVYIARSWKGTRRPPPVPPEVQEHLKSQGWRGEALLKVREDFSIQLFGYGWRCGLQIGFVHLFRPSPKGISAKASRVLSGETMAVAYSWHAASIPWVWPMSLCMLEPLREEMGLCTGRRMAVLAPHGRRLE